MHYTLPQLIALDERYPTERKLLVVPSINFGRELLAALAQERGSWIGWEVATLATIAQKLSVVALAKNERRRGSDVAVAQAVSSAFDSAIAAGRVNRNLADLASRAGTRTALVDAVLELRMSGATPVMLRSVGALGVASSLAAVADYYDAICRQQNLADPADVFSAAVDSFHDESRFVLDHSVMVCTPGWSVRGWPSKLLEFLVQHGLRVLSPAHNDGSAIPENAVDQRVPLLDAELEVALVTRSMEMFSAGTIADELRQVVRKVLADGCTLDDVELVCTDRDTYAIELDALFEHINANYTTLDGLPLTTTRIGRAVDRWFSWLDSDYTAEHVRGGIESGDWELDGRVPGSQIAAELRWLQIGWGLTATRNGRARLTSERVRGRIRQLDDEAGPDFERRQGQRFAAMDALAALLDVLISNAPEFPGAPGNGAPTSVPTLADNAIRVITALVHPRGAAEESTLQRVLERLAEIAAVPREAVNCANALATLRHELSDLRAWTDRSNTPRPRRSTGGHLHLTNIEAAGATGRPQLFLVGLDADRAAGPVTQSPLLPDSLRLRLNERGANLATTDQRRREGAWKIRNAMHSSTSSLTLSYAIRGGGSDGRDNTLAPALLQAARDNHKKPDLNYEELREILGTPASAIPTGEDAPIDERDVWLRNMSDGPLLFDATSVARAHFPALDRGLRAQEARDGDETGAYHGLVPDAGRLDPRRTGRPISPSSLEMIASCSLRWFYAAALNARAPEEPAYDAMVWLNPLERGSALHSVYERLIRERIHEMPAGGSRDDKVAAAVTEIAAVVERDIPVPGPAVKTRELQALLNDALLFVSSEHDAFVREPWEVAALESQFGSAEPAVLPLDDGTQLLVHGRVDRVDRLRDGTLRLVDYKTGRSFVMDAKRGAFDGGRKLQLAVYSPAIAAQLDAVVSVAEYRFPTERGEGEVARANAELVAAAPRIVRLLLDDVAAGRFVPTIDKTDCAWCEYAVVCRTSREEFSHESPRAAWAATHADESPHFIGVITRKRSGESQ